MTVLCSVILMITLTGCERNYGEEIEKRYRDMENYTAKVCFAVNGAEYELLQSYQRPDTFRSEVLSPKHLKGTVSEVTPEEFRLTGGNFSSVKLPRTAKESLAHLQLRDFFLAYYEDGTRLMKVTEDNGILLECKSKGDHRYIDKQVLRLNQKSLLPETLLGYHQDGSEVFRIVYLEFKKE